MNLNESIRALYQAETDLTDRLLQLATDYSSQPEIHHVARDLVAWSQRHVDELRTRYHLEPQPEPGPVATIWSAFSGDLLGDLRALHVAAAGVSLDWELLGQGAQAMKDTELLELTQRCHPETLRQMRWANAMLKVLSPQQLASRS
jgi:hypothetical protein